MTTNERFKIIIEILSKFILSDTVHDLNPTRILINVMQF